MQQDPVALATALQDWAATHLAVPPAFAADELVLDPNVKYIFGPAGNVLMDPMTNKPLVDDWWNGFIGFQAGLIRGLDAQLRVAGVNEAFGWSIVIYTAFLKILFYPLQQGQLKSASMMQLLQPKVKEIQAKYKDDPEAQQRLLGQLYTSMDVNPLGGCLPLLLQIPLFWSLYGAWRRLSAEKFPHYEEPWLWVPSLAKPNPDFQFKLDWLMEFKDGQPVMGWHDYLCYLIFPVVLVGFTVVSQKQTQPKPQEGDDSNQLLTQVLPWVSVYFIGAISLELPQAVSVYYSTNTLLSLAQTSFVKFNLRQEIPGYEEFERTGKFPDSAFDEAIMTKIPMPKNMHEAALRGNVQYIQDLFEEGKFDLEAWDEKEIAPMGYAVACGHAAAVRFFLEKGANIQRLDGQNNTMLHYAAGYGHKEVLEVLLEAAEEVWPENEWATKTNKKGQTVLDAARVNRKGGVLDFLNQRLGLEPSKEDVAASAPKAVDAEVVAPAPASDDAERARAALLAAAGGQPAQAAAPSSAPVAPAPEEALRAAVSKMKDNPQAVEEARKLMKGMPPQLLSMLSGNKLSPEQAEKAMKSMQDMSAEEILEKADGAAQLLGKATAAGAPEGSKKEPLSTRAVD